MALALFTEAPILPHPKVDLSVLLILEDAIRSAWTLMKQEPPKGLNLATDVEETINFYLHETLSDRVWNRELVEGFDEIIFRDIQSAPEVCNYNHEELKKKPDIFVKLAGRPNYVKPSQDGIFIECKPVDKDHSLVSHYCKRGIIRFVDGRYAWAMQEALMVGYTFGISDNVALLANSFEKGRSIVLPNQMPVACIIEKSVSVSRHSRNFRYVETGRHAPDITIRHLWLNRSN